MNATQLKPCGAHGFGHDLKISSGEDEVFCACGGFKAVKGESGYHLFVADGEGWTATGVVQKAEIEA